MKKSEIIKGAKQVFEAHPSQEKIIATSDGNYFLMEAVNLARDHARKIGGTTFEISKEGEAITEEKPEEKAKEESEAKVVTIAKQKVSAKAKK